MAMVTRVTKLSTTDALLLSASLKANRFAIGKENMFSFIHYLTSSHFARRQCEVYVARYPTVRHFDVITPLVSNGSA